jgi:hypothetical protein
MAAWEGPTCFTDGQCVAGCAPVDPDCACAADGQCTTACANLLSDPDCPKDCIANGVCALDACPSPDTDCVAAGGACASELSCKGRACVSDEQHPVKYCSVPCTTTAQCPTGMECTDQLVCLLPQRPTKVAGEKCDAAADFCSGGKICTGPTGAITRCVQGCVLQGDCALGTCEGGAGGLRYCRPPESVLSFNDTIVIPRAVAEGPAAPAGGCAAAGFGDLSMLGLLLSGLWLRLKRRAFRPPS